MGKSNAINKNKLSKRLSQSTENRQYHTTPGSGQKKHSAWRKSCDIGLILVELVEKGAENVQRLSQCVVRARVVGKIKHIIEIFKENLIVVNRGTVFILGSVPDFLAILHEKSNNFTENIHNIHWLDLCFLKETFVVYPTSIQENYVIQKSQETREYFTELSNYLGDVIRSNSYRKVFLKDLSYSSGQDHSWTHSFNESLSSFSTDEKKTGWKGVKNKESNPKGFRLPRSISKVLSPRHKKREITSLPELPVRTFVCYPFTGQFHFNPAMTEDISFPTQVSEQDEPGQSEVVFSSGRAMAVGHVTHGQAIHEASANQGNFTQGFRTILTSKPVLQPQVTQKRPRKPPRYPEYVEFAQRLRSFARWVKRYPDPTTLCEAGFFYTNEADLVRCCQCGIGLKDFSFGDNPLKEHVRYSRDCVFLKEDIEPDLLAKLKTEVLHEDNARALTGSRHGSGECRHYEYMSYTARLSSFSRWPSRHMQTPQQLAEAGFFYTGFEDNVRCYACDGGLRQWDPDDDPWTEHCRWFPNCPYVKEQKGEDFVKLLQTTLAVENQQDDITKTDDQKPDKKHSSDITSELERLTLKDPELNAVIAEHREACTEMGYPENVFEKAACKLARKGNVRPTIEEILDAMEAYQQEEREATRRNAVTETPTEENMRLKSMIKCMTCGVNDVNALFLPCTHHRMCQDCAALVNRCPVCGKQIRQKIRTYMA